MQTDHAGLTGLKWAQYVSGVVGLMIVCWAVFAHLRKLPLINPPRPPRALTPGVLIAVVALAALIGLVSAMLKVPVGFHSMAFHGVVNSLIAFAAGTACACAAWQLAIRKQAA